MDTFVNDHKNKDHVSIVKETPILDRFYTMKSLPGFMDNNLAVPSYNLQSQQMPYFNKPVSR